MLCMPNMHAKNTMCGFIFSLVKGLYHIIGYKGKDFLIDKSIVFVYNLTKNNQKGFLMAINKRSLIAHTSAAVVATCLVLFGCVQCQGRKNAERDAQSKQNVINSSNIENQNRGTVIDSLQNELTKADRRNAQYLVTINELNDSIHALNCKLQKCQNKKTKVKTVTKEVIRHDTVYVEKPDTSKCKVSVYVYHKKTYGR